jgi:hypothetical protein
MVYPFNALNASKNGQQESTATPSVDWEAQREA